MRRPPFRYHSMPFSLFSISIFRQIIIASIHSFIRFATLFLRLPGDTRVRAVKVVYSIPYSLRHVSPPFAIQIAYSLRLLSPSGFQRFR